MISIYSVHTGLGVIDVNILNALVSVKDNIICTHLIVIIPWVEHDDGTAIVLMYHPPQINHRVRQWHLTNDVLVAAPVSLRN